MSEKINALERLAELRRRGTLSADEYQTEKDKLLNADRSDNGASYWHRNRSWLTAVSGTVGLAVAIFVIKPMLRLSATSDVASSNSTTAWTIAEKRDPMNDAVVRTATQTFNGSAAIIEFTITCSSNGQASYRAASFNQDTTPVAMRSDISDSGNQYVDYQYRVDAREPQLGRYINPPFSNVVQIELQPLPEPVRERETAQRFRSGEIGDLRFLRAKRITFAFNLAHSNEAIVVDQTDAALRAMLEPCIRAELRAIGNG